MNARTLVLAPWLLAAPGLIAQSHVQGNTPPPLVQAVPRAASPTATPGEQRIFGPAPGTLIAREAADGVLEGFRKIYVNDGAPRVVIYVNRALIDAAAPSDAGTNQDGSAEAAKSAPALADQQTVREIERLFGRAFRHAGAQLADYNAAASLLPEQPGARLVGDQASKQREALANVADIAIEVLISTRSLNVPEVSGTVTYSVPDIQATAIRLKDAAIVGQADASDILGKGARAGRIAQQFDLADIAEATALALMEDMLTGKKK